MLNVLTLALLLTSLACVAAPERAQHRDSSLQFMASDGDWVSNSFTGHAFVCLQRETDSGVTEDCFGFYPRTTGRALVGGPGVVDKEFDFSKRPPTKLANVKVSVRTPITIEQHQKALAFIRGFDKDFALTSRNCVLFASELAKLGGLKTPKSSSFRTPVEYLNELRKMNPGATTGTAEIDGAKRQALNGRGTVLCMPAAPRHSIERSRPTIWPFAAQRDDRVLA